MRLEFLLPRSKAKPAQNLVINSNDRFHYQAEGRMVKKLRLIARVEAGLNITPVYSSDKPCTVAVTVYAPTRRRLDPPNLYPTVKALIDGLTDANLWPDDNHEVIKMMSFQYGGLSGESGKFKIVLDIEGT